MHSSEKILFVIPALPGFYVLTPCFDETGAICEAPREPVVAWALDSLGCTHPVAMCDGLQDRGDPAVLCPDGKVRAFNKEWGALAEWLADQKAKSAS